LLCGNVFTEPLPSDNRYIFTEPLPNNERNIQTHKIMGGIYVIRHWDGLMCHDIHTILIKIVSGIRKLIGGGNSQAHRQHGDRISLLYESRLKAGEWSIRNAKNIDRRVMIKSRLKMFGKSFVLSCDSLLQLSPHFIWGTVLSLLHWRPCSFNADIEAESILL
jgi:hypothetical protein